MNAEQFFGKELTEVIKEFLVYSCQLEPEERMNLANCVREEAGGEDSPLVKEVLNRLADIVETDDGKEVM